MYNDNNRKLRTLLLVLAIVLVLLRIVKIAKAEEVPADYPIGGIPQYARDYIVSTYFSGASDSYKQSIYNSFDVSSQFLFCEYSDHDCSLAVIVKYGTFIWSNGCGNPTINTSDGSYNFTYNSNTFHGISRIITTQQYGYGSKYSTYSSGDPMIYYFHKINNGYFSQILTCNGLYRNQGSYGYNYYGRSNSNISSSKQEASGAGILISYGDVFCCSNLNSDFWIEYRCLIKSNYQNIIPSYTEDSRLKFWTFDNLDGSKTLVTDLSEFLQGTEDIMDNQISGLVLTYELDNIEHTLTLDSSNSIIRRSGTATSYRVETPFSAFGFDSSVTEFDITKCDFTLTYSAYGYTTTENYKVSCDYSAFRQSSPVEPALIPSPAVSDPTVDSSVYTFINNVYGSYSSDRYGRSGTWDVASSEPSDVSVFRSVDVYHFANEEHGSGVDESLYYYSLLDWSNTQLNITAYTVFDWDKFLYENTSALYFDVISVPIYHFTPVGQSSTISGRVFDGYALFYTPSYFLRQQYGLLGDILTVVDQDAQNQYNNGIWLVDKINDFEDKTLDALNASLDIENDSLSWLKTIDNSIKSLDFPVFDDSSILSGLASIVTALSGNGSNELGVNGRLDKLINFFIANDAQKNESALAYRNWLDGLDSTETRRVTHFGTNIYSLVKNIFDIFDADYTENPSFENPDKDYLGIASDFIDALNNIDNSNKFFRGFFDSSFDPLEQSGLPEE